MVVDTKLYDVLQVKVDATPSEIKKSYRRLVLRYHPDKNDGDDTKFKEIDAAYKVLSDENARSHYDRTGKLQSESSPNVDDYLSELFPSLFSFRGQFRKAKGPNVQHVLAVTLENLYHGVVKKLAINKRALCKSCRGDGGFDVVMCSRCMGQGAVLIQQQQGPMMFTMQQTCPACKGDGKVPNKTCDGCKGQKYVTRREQVEVKIPKGTRHGQQFVFTGLADDIKNAETGDLVVIVAEKPHATYKRVGDDLHTTVTIPLTTALIGGTVELEHLSGETKSITILKGQVVHPGQTTTFEKQGMNDKGNLHVQFKIEMPSDEWAEKVDADLVRKLFQD